MALPTLSLVKMYLIIQLQNHRSILIITFMYRKPQ